MAKMACDNEALAYHRLPRARKEFCGAGEAVCQPARPAASSLSKSFTRIYVAGVPADRSWIVMRGAAG